MKTGKDQGIFMKNRVIFMVQMILNLGLLLALIMAGIVGISNRDAGSVNTVPCIMTRKGIFPSMLSSLCFP